MKQTKRLTKALIQVNMIFWGAVFMTSGMDEFLVAGAVMALGYLMDVRGIRGANA